METTQSIGPAAAMTLAREHLLKQGRRAGGPHGGCFYRLWNGERHLKCPVGALITDAAYDPVIEGLGVSAAEPSGGKWIAVHSDRVDKSGAFAMAKALNQSGIEASERMLELLVNLQHIHDTFPPEQWPMRLDELARGMGLEVQP